jgi:hypothetical protein
MFDHEASHHEKIEEEDNKEFWSNVNLFHEAYITMRKWGWIKRCFGTISHDSQLAFELSQVLLDRARVVQNEWKLKPGKEASISKDADINCDVLSLRPKGIVYPSTSSGYLHLRRDVAVGRGRKSSKISTSTVELTAKEKFTLDRMLQLLRKDRHCQMHETKGVFSQFIDLVQEIFEERHDFEFTNCLNLAEAIQIQKNDCLLPWELLHEPIYLWSSECWTPEFEHFYGKIHAIPVLKFNLPHNRWDIYFQRFGAKEVNKFFSNPRIVYWSD